MTEKLASRIRIGALLACCTWLGWLLFDMHLAHPMPRSTAPSPSASVAAAPSPAPLPMDKAIDPDDVAVRIKNESIDRCELGGGIVAMGFGFKVVCLKPQCVEWTRSPGFRPFKTELKR